MKLRIAGLLLALVALCAACQAGWTAPITGTGDGSGTIPGTTGVANGAVSLGAPVAEVAIPGGGFYVYDAATCAIYRTVGATTTLYAGTPGSCDATTIGDGGPASAARISAGTRIFLSIYLPPFYLPALALDSAGNLYFPSQNGTALRRVDAATGTISTIPVPGGNLVVGLATAPDGSLAVLQTSGLSEYTAPTGFHAVTTVQVPCPDVCGAAGLATAGEGRYAVWLLSRFGATLGRLDPTTGVVTDSGVSVASPPLTVNGQNWIGSLPTATADGAAYTSTTGTNVVRIALDDTVTVIGGNGTADPGTTAQSGLATTLALSPAGLAITPGGNLLIGSGHVVYDLADPAGVS